MNLVFALLVGFVTGGEFSYLMIAITGGTGGDLRCFPG